MYTVPKIIWIAEKYRSCHNWSRYSEKRIFTLYSTNMSDFYLHAWSGPETIVIYRGISPSLLLTGSVQNIFGTVLRVQYMYCTLAYIYCTWYQTRFILVCIVYPLYLHCTKYLSEFWTKILFIEFSGHRTYTLCVCIYCT